MKTAWTSLKNFFLRFDVDGDNEDDNVDDDNTAGDDGGYPEIEDQVDIPQELFMMMTMMNDDVDDKIWWTLYKTFPLDFPT